MTGNIMTGGEGAGIDPKTLIIPCATTDFNARLLQMDIRWFQTGSTESLPLGNLAGPRTTFSDPPLDIKVCSEVVFKEYQGDCLAVNKLMIAPCLQSILSFMGEDSDNSMSMPMSFKA